MDAFRQLSRIPIGFCLLSQRHVQFLAIIFNRVRWNYVNPLLDFLTRYERYDRDLGTKLRGRK